MRNLQDFTNLALAAIALVGLFAACYQLKTMQLSTRASVLLGLDERLASQPMQEAVQEMTALIDRINTKANEQWPALSRKERRKKALDLYPVELEQMRQDLSSLAYTNVIRVCAFFDTVGYVTASKYVPLRDVLRLFSPAIDDAGSVFESHILKLKDEYNEDVYDNFLWLIKQSKVADREM